MGQRPQYLNVGSTGWMLLAFVVGATHLPALAAPDDFEVDVRAKDAAATNVRGQRIVDQLTIEQMESWVFSTSGNNREGWIKQCEGGLTSRLAEIEAIEPFNEQQRAALKLAMQGEIQRVMVQFDKFLEKHPPNNGAVNIEEWQALWQEIQPLRQQVSQGVFRNDSLFTKAFRQVASESQWNKLKQLEKERRKKRWDLAVQLMVVQLEQACPMRHEQREALTKVLSERNPPVIDADGNGLYIAFSALATTPAEKWKRLFDDRQLPKVEKYIERYQGMQITEEANDE